METLSPADARPDLAAAARIRRSVDRVVWQRVELHDEGAEVVVAGIRHRRPVHLRIGLGAALALAEAGVPTVTRRVGTRA